MIKAHTWSGAQSVLAAERRQYSRIQIAVQIELRPDETNVPMRLSPRYFVIAWVSAYTK